MIDSNKVVMYFVAEKEHDVIVPIYDGSEYSDDDEEDDDEESGS